MQRIHRFFIMVFGALLLFAPGAFARGTLRPAAKPRKGHMALGHKGKRGHTVKPYKGARGAAPGHR